MLWVTKHMLVFFLRITCETDRMIFVRYGNEKSRGQNSIILNHRPLHNRHGTIYAFLSCVVKYWAFVA